MNFCRKLEGTIAKNREEELHSKCGSQFKVNCKVSESNSFMVPYYI